MQSHPGGLLFTKFGGNQTALLDFALPDCFSRLQERSKESSKTMKQLAKLFPNKIIIQPPQSRLSAEPVSSLLLILQILSPCPLSLFFLFLAFVSTQKGDGFEISRA
ncbi:hypothetical protein BHE74_00031978 [Ensete ventricosum]|nr:hypothetical protein GW17_00008402 [Ensete ventricosum]RWW60986.1 hypothetical protein BHE74_00031978 [Ensete ventricosum]RZS04253.1 hypothetical protein BHM03_00034563 [Ensete ventricosum]